MNCKLQTSCVWQFEPFLYLNFFYDGPAVCIEIFNTNWLSDWVKMVCFGGFKRFIFFFNACIESLKKNVGLK
ncbi:hypothetical protein Hanom_Chr15g01379861 [Helianthus anomalus]